MSDEKSILSEQDKRNFCALMLQQYGLQIDVENELLPVFFVAYRSALMSEDASIKAGENIQHIIDNFEKTAAAKINKLEMKQFHFNSSKDAFWFAFGKYGILSVIISVLLFAGWLFNRIDRKKEKDIDHISFLLKSSFIKDKKINDTTSTRLITLYPAKDLNSALAGKNYVYLQDCNCIEIPLFYHRTITTK